MAPSVQTRWFVAIVLAVVLAAGGGIFDDRGARRHGGGQGGQRCDVDLDQWKARVRHFEQNDRQNRDTLRKTKDDLVRDLERLDTAACQREVRRQISDLIDEVREENL